MIDRALSLRYLMLLVWLFSCSAGCRAQDSPELAVAAASDLQFAFPELGRALERATGVRVAFTFGATGVLAQQIENGAPIDLFASADRQRIANLRAAGLLVDDTITLFARGHLVLAVPRTSDRSVASLRDLLQPAIRRVAIANPVHAPYGAAAEQALTSAGVIELVRHKLVLAESARHAATLVESGAVDAGLLAKSAASDRGVRAVAIDERLHQPIEQSIAVLQRSLHVESAREFVGFLVSPEGRAILRRHQFDTAESLELAPVAEPPPRSKAVDGLQPLWLTAGVSLCATVLAISLGTPLAWVLARREFRGRHLLNALVLQPLVIPPTVLGYYLLVLLGGTSPIGVLFDDVLALPLVFTARGAIVAALVSSLPLYVGAARAAIEAIDPRLEDVARLLGRTEWSVVRTITLPLARRGIAAGAVLAFARATGDFGTTLMVMGNLPGRVPTVSIAIYDAWLAGDTARTNLLVGVATAFSIGVLWIVSHWTTESQGRRDSSGRPRESSAM